MATPREDRPNDGDPLAALRHFAAAKQAEMDQALAQVGDVTRYQAAMFAGYLAAGMSRWDALVLTALLITSSPDKDGDDGSGGD